MASEIKIQELGTTDPIYIVLRSRALPYRGMPTGGEQRVSTTWYQGNPKATQQIMGETFEPTEISGMWKSKFIRVVDARETRPAERSAPDVEIRGGVNQISGGALGAEALVVIFEQLRSRGNELLFEWGPVTRYGILQSFTPRWIREEDVEWSATFNWNGAEPTAPPVRRLALPGQPVQEAVVNTDTALARFTRRVAEAPAIRRVSALVARAREASVAFLGYTRQAADAVTLPARVAQGALSQAAQIRDDVSILTGQVMDVPYTYMGLSDSVTDVFSIEGWRRDVGRQAESLAAKAQMEAEQLRSFVLSEDARSVTVQEGQSLRTIALIYYGSADDWTTIAAENNLPSSLVPAGTVVRVPLSLSGAVSEANP